MANPHTELLEMVLRDCGQHNPWYPAEFAKATGVPREALDMCLDQLRIHGLVHLTPWVQGQGQGYQLTRYGAEVLEQPRLLGRLRSGDVPTAPAETAPAPTPTDSHALRGLRGEQVRAALLDESRPVVTQVLLTLNVVWFVVGMLLYITRYEGNAGEYLAGGGDLAIELAYQDLGWLDIVDVMDHQQWWRLLSCGFLHAGALHLAMNMYGLFVLGPLLEKMWGRAAFLAIYLLSCIGSSAVALVFTPDKCLVGASGALCGLLGSMATWVYLSRHYLPRQIVGAWRNNIIQNVVLIALISLLPTVSMAGHAGGGVVGAVVSAPLWLARFGRGSQRLLGWLGMIVIAAVGLGFELPALAKIAESEKVAESRARAGELQRYRKTRFGHERNNPDAGRKGIDELVNKEKAAELLMKAEEVTVGIQNLAADIFKVRPDKWDPATSAEFQKRQLKLQSYMGELLKAKTSTPQMGRAIKTGLAWFSAANDFCDKMSKACATGEPLTPEARKTLMGEYREVTNLRDPWLTAWNNANK